MLQQSKRCSEPSARVGGMATAGSAMASQIEGIAAQLEELQRRQRQQQEQHKELLEQRRKLAAELDAEKAVLRAMEGADPAGDSATPKCVRKTAAAMTLVFRQQV